MFAQPFNELLVWAVLTKRQAMAQLMWQHGEEALAKALIASKLYRAMAHEAADDDLEVEIYDELRGYAGEFETEALELLDYSYRLVNDLKTIIYYLYLHIMVFCYNYVAGKTMI
jgi:transient receptor potential cation channel subfamily M member 3